MTSLLSYKKYLCLGVSAALLSFAFLAWSSPAHATTLGCMDYMALNYDVNADEDDGSCIYPEGCTDSMALNYDSLAINDDGSCEYQEGCTDSTATNYDVMAYIDDGSCEYAEGCMDFMASNYDSEATIDDGSCIYPEGCMDFMALNYDSNAVSDDGSCVYAEGCTDSAATNYDPIAYIDDGTCEYTEGCMDSLASNYDETAIYDDGSCIYPEGCTDSMATNYDANAVNDDGSCVYPEGCTDSTATNYDPIAYIDDGSCTFGGCTDPLASNYDSNATCNDLTCEYDDICIDDPANSTDTVVFCSLNNDTVDDYDEYDDNVWVDGINRTLTLRRACVRAYAVNHDDLSTIPPLDFVNDCHAIAVVCQGKASEHALGPSSSYKEAWRHRCLMATLSCTYGDKVARDVGYGFEKFGGDCNFDVNKGKCPEITLDDHTTWETGDACESKDLADSCRDTLHNQQGRICARRYCDYYRANGNLFGTDEDTPICCTTPTDDNPNPALKPSDCNSGDSKLACIVLGKYIANTYQQEVYRPYSKDSDGDGENESDCRVIAPYNPPAGTSPHGDPAIQGTYCDLDDSTLPLPDVDEVEDGLKYNTRYPYDEGA